MITKKINIYFTELSKDYFMVSFGRYTPKDLTKKQKVVVSAYGKNIWGFQINSIAGNLVKNGFHIIRKKIK